MANEHQKQLFCVIELIENIFCIKIEYTNLELHL